MMNTRMIRGVAALLALASVACSRGGSAGGAPTPSGASAMAMPADVTPSNIALGDSLFNNGGCIRCHGAKGVGAVNGPALNDAQWVQLKTGAYDEIVAVITSGVPAANIKDPARKTPMRARGGPMALTDPQIKAVAAYVYSISRK
jgi:mono/diheme cytochrome c family protein